MFAYNSSQYHWDQAMRAKRSGIDFNPKSNIVNFSTCVKHWHSWLASFPLLLIRNNDIKATKELRCLTLLSSTEAKLPMRKEDENRMSYNCQYHQFILTPFHCYLTHHVKKSSLYRTLNLGYCNQFWDTKNNGIIQSGASFIKRILGIRVPENRS